MTLCHSGPGSANYIPFLDDTPEVPKWVDFETWWSTPVFIDTEGKDYSRQDLVLHVANTDGGVHVDPKIDADYAKLSRKNALGRMYHDGKSWHPMRDPHLAAIRQIGHELLKTLKPGYSKTVSQPAGITIGNICLNVASVEATEPTKKSEKPTKRRDKIGRNEPCPCGSGLKYKKCCGI